MKNIDDYLDFLIIEKGKDIIHNDLEKRAIITDAKSKISYYDDKFIRTDFQVNTGDIIEFNEDTYIIISQIDKNEKSYKGKMRKCNCNIIKIILGEEVIIGWDSMGRPIYGESEPTIKEYPSIIETTVLDMETDQPIILLENKIQVTIGSNENTNTEFVEGGTFSALDKDYKILGIDKFKTGLLIMKCEITTI